jgi:hypothetical protein
MIPFKVLGGKGKDIFLLLIYSMQKKRSDLLPGKQGFAICKR